MTVEINYEAEEKLHIPYRKIITKAVEACIEAEKCPYEAEVSVTIVDGPAIRELNRAKGRFQLLYRLCAAAAIVLFAIVLTVTCINLLVSRRHVHY